MRKRLLIALGATVALVAAATAYAAFTASGITATTATLTTTTANNVKTRQCTGDDGKAFTITDAKFTGAVDFTNPAADLDGPATFHIRTTVDDASHLGVVDGDLKVHDSDTDFHGRFTGTLDSAGKFSGFFTGDAHKGSKAKVWGTLSGTFAGNTGFASPGASLGGAPTGLAVVAGPVCKKAPKPKPPKPNPPAPHNKRFDIHGTISAIAPGPPVAITVTGKGPTTATCSTDTSSPSTAGFAVNDKVKMKCEQISGTWFLRELKKDPH